MNPYDFVPINWMQKPVRKKPVWHYALSGTTNCPLYSGYLDVDIIVETPLFILDPVSNPYDARKPAEHIRNRQGEYIIPGSSLKGLLRCVVETLGNGCLTLFDGVYEPVKGQRYRYKADYNDKIDKNFTRCAHNHDLCIACRIFGMMQPGERNADTFLGKVNIGDARAFDETLSLYDPPMFTKVLDTPKPRHRSFYLDQNEHYIAGRKYYFHHSAQAHPLQEDRLLPIANQSGKFRNQHIQPIDRATFFTRINFSHLEAEELALLLLASILHEHMRHKIGYGKALGLGSIRIMPVNLRLVDYAKRYTSQHAKRGIEEYVDEELDYLIENHMKDLGDKNVTEALHYFKQQSAMKHLERIWRWPVDKHADIHYPSQDWFKRNPRARIEATIDAY